MRITLSTNVSAKKKKKNHLQRRFDKLWEQVCRQQKKNERLRKEMAKLELRYREHMAPVEREAAEPFARLGERLNDFLTRKSLGKHQRIELSEWARECIDRVMAVDPEAGNRLGRQYNEAIAELVGMDVDALEAEALARTRGQGAQFAEDDDNREDPDSEPNPQADMFGFDDEERDAFDADGFASAFEPPGAPEAPPPGPDIFSEDWLRSLFRRTAQALHPDREPDPERRREKHGLMSRLLAARDNRDIFELLDLHQSWVNDAELLVDKEQLSAVCEQLEHKKELLAREHDQITGGNPQAAMLYAELHGKPQVEVERWLKALAAEERQRHAEIDALAASLRNLTVLKQALAQRREAEIDAFAEFEAFIDAVLRR